MFRTGDFILHSGQHTPVKIECDNAVQDNWEALAKWAYEDLGARFCHVTPVLDSNGNAGKFAAALRPYVDPSSHFLLIVDDVYTTGDTLRKHAARLTLAPPYALRGLVAFAREPIADPWVFAVCLVGAAQKTRWKPWD